MKRSRFSETQIVSILKEADAGMRVKEMCHKYGISDENLNGLGRADPSACRCA